MLDSKIQIIKSGKAPPEVIREVNWKLDALFIAVMKNIGKPVRLNKIWLEEKVNQFKNCSVMEKIQWYQGHNSCWSAIIYC